MLSYIPQNKFFDMTELFKILMDQQVSVSVFPFQEYWIDIGRLRDYNKANGDYCEEFL